MTGSTESDRAVKGAPRRGLASLVVLAVCVAATAQDGDSRPHLKNLGPAGVRSNLTESWGVLGFALSNPTNEDMEGRVLTFYSTASGRQYGRDVWAPAKSTIRSWSCIGPPPGPPDRNVVELKSLLYDRTGGTEHLLRSPQGPPVYSDLVRYYRGEPGTVLMVDADIADGSQSPPSADALARANNARDLVRLFRHQARLSERIYPVTRRSLPPFAEALDCIDHFVLGSDRIADDVAGRRMLREWVERGGTLWVMLDLVGQETVTSLLGDGLDLQVVDRVGLTHIQFRNGPNYSHRADIPAIDMEEPVDFVRMLAPGQNVLYSVDGWPAASVMDLGRGRVFFTALGARGWMRDRTAHDQRPRFKEFPNLPVALVPFEFLAAELHPNAERPPLAGDDLRASVVGQIGYSVVKRGTVLWVFAGLFLALAAAAAFLGRKGWLQQFGWVGPALALGAGAVFIGLGDRSRGAVPPTVAVTQVVDAMPGLDEVEATGYLAVYQPSPSPSGIGAEQGGTFDLDLADLEGRVHRRVQTDLDRWHWENVDLPSGVRSGPFRHTLRTDKPVEAIVRFGPNGLEGRVHSGPFGPLEDVVLSTPGRHTLAVHVAPGGAMSVGSEDELHGGQLVVGGLLTDQQRARQDLYQKLLADPQPRSIANRGVLLAWSNPVDLHFRLVSDARTTGAALLAIPLQFERTPPDTPVTIPAAFPECRRVTSDGRHLPVATESPLATTMSLRFQIPPTVMPMDLDGARLFLKLAAPGREVVVGAVTGGGIVPLRTLTAPFGVERVDLDPRLVKPDGQGAITLSLRFAEAGGAGVERKQWRLESAGLELRGRTRAAGDR